MTTYKVKIWLSEKLINYSYSTWNEPYRAAKVAETYLEKAFHNHADSADVSYSTTGIPVPQEGCGGFDGTEICNDDDNYWNTLFDWWRNYARADCTDLTLVRDTNLLITNHYECSWGWGDGHWATACCGKALLSANPDNYKKFGSQCEDEAIDAVQEEVAHSLHWNNSNPDKDGDGEVPHDYGTVKYKDNKGYITPVGQVGEGEEAFDAPGVNYNNCDEYADKSDTDWDGNDNADGWAHWYSDCSIDYFTMNPGP